MSFFTESNLPGIGKKITLSTHLNEKAVLIIHHDGKREFYIMDKFGEPITGITLLDEESRRLSSFLSGAIYKPASVQHLEKALGGINIDWFKIENNSKAIGKSIHELDIRQKTNVSIIAILKNNDEFIPNPSSDYIIQNHDTCIVISKSEGFKKFVQMIRGE